MSSKTLEECTPVGRAYSIYVAWRRMSAKGDSLFHWSLPSLLNRTKGQLKFSARGEELALERVVKVVVHVKQQIRIVTQTVLVTDVPAVKWLNVRQSNIFPYFSSKSKIFIQKCSTFIYNPPVLPSSQKFRTRCFSPTLYTEYKAIQALENFSMTRPDTVLQ